jgi:outer membrane protein assembly factor BamB
MLLLLCIGVTAIPGSLVWKHQVAEIQDVVPVLNSVGSLFVCGTSDGTVYSLSAKDGSMLWKRAVAEPEWGFISSPTLSGGRSSVLYVAGDKSVLALDEKSGNIHWNHTFDATVRTHPVLDSGTLLFVFAGDNVYALDCKDGSVIWTAYANARYRSSPAFSLDGTKMYLSSLNSIVALDRKNGKLLWNQTMPGVINPALTSPIRSNDGATLFVGAHANVYAFSSADGSLTWKASVSFEVFGEPSLSPDGAYLYVGTANNNLYKLDVHARGAVQWVHNFGGFGE